MRYLIYIFILACYLPGIPAHALDPVAPRSERRFGLVYVKTPNPDDKVTLISQRVDGKTQKIKPGEDVKVKVGDYLVTVEMGHDYIYNQDISVRPTERHEVITPGYGNLRVNGPCKEVLVSQGGKKIAKIKCGKIRILPRGSYDLKIKIGKYTLDQTVAVVTNTLREIDVKK